MHSRITLLGHVSSFQTITDKHGEALVRCILMTSKKIHRHERHGIATDKTPEHIISTHPVFFFGPLAAVFQKHAKKGSLLYVEGVVENRAVDMPDGTSKWQYSVQCTMFRVLNNDDRPISMNDDEEVNGNR